jgi:Tfp pilus assembly protein FimT
MKHGRNQQKPSLGVDGFSLMELMLVVGLTAVIATMAVPMITRTVGGFTLTGDAHALANAASLAKLRAAAAFTQSRLFVDLGANSFHVETWQKGTPGSWVTEGGITGLASNDTFSFGVVGSAPPNSQTTIAQAPACVSNAGTAIGNTACVLFNSRGIPVAAAGAPPAVGAPTGSDVLYLTDGTAVYGLTLSATGLIHLWRTNPTVTPSWGLQ